MSGERETDPGAPGAPETAVAALEREAARFREDVERLTHELGRVLLGQEAVIEQVLVALLARGHALVEGLPGLGKTLLARALGQALGLSVSRIQFTPDLMPADITGTMMLQPGDGGARRLEFEPGPLFAHVVLGDEINRATPKTQSALLEAMEERQVTAGRQTRPLPDPFLVIATQNPIELEGTYPLPEAQIDRFFFKVRIGMPAPETTAAILTGSEGWDGPLPEPVLSRERALEMQRLARRVPVPGVVVRELVRWLHATHPGDPGASEAAKRFLVRGASVRAGRAVLAAARIKALVAGRLHVGRADLEWALLPALRHRIGLNVEAELEGLSGDDVLRRVLEECAG